MQNIIIGVGCVEVASDAGVDGVSDNDAWSIVKWFMAKGGERDQYKDLCAGPLSIVGSSVIIKSIDRL